MSGKIKPSFFVTGGTGFVGSRLAQVLQDQLGASVTVLAHRTSPGALRLSAMGVKMDFTPITDAKGLTKVVAGHDAIFHLAYGRTGGNAETRKTTVDGTQAMIDAALASGVKRFVNVSTAAVYFGAPDGIADETTPMRKWAFEYSNEKLDAENQVRSATSERGLEGSIFQLAGVYGPWGETFISNPLANMRRGIVVLPNHGNGVANMTFVDDVVQCILLGLKDEAVGETFIVKGPGRITRGEAYAKLEEMLGYSAVETMSTEDVKKASRGSRGEWRAIGGVVKTGLSTLRGSDDFKAAVRRTPLVPVLKPIYRAIKPSGPASTPTMENPAVNTDTTLPRFYPPKVMVDYLAAEVEFTSAKAKRLLGYAPQVDLDEGMAITRDWAEWANLLGPRIS